MNTDAVRLVSNGAYWKAIWSTGSGTRAEKSLGAKDKITKAEARRRCQEIAREHAISPGRRDVLKAPTLREWQAQFIAGRANLSPKTLALYRQTFESLAASIGLETRIDRIRKPDAARWYASMLARVGPDGLSEMTVVKHTRNAKTIFGAALAFDFVTSNPFGPLKSTPPEIEKDWFYWDDITFGRLLESADDPHYRAGLGLCRWAGLRPNEMMRVTPADIDWQAATLRVKAARRMDPRRAKVTTKQRSRTVPIEPRLMVLLRASFEAMADGQVTLWNRSDHNNLQRDLHALIKRAGLPPVAEPWKTMRKNCETDWQSRPDLTALDVAAWIGHDVKVSAAHYHRTKPESLAKVSGVGGESEVAMLRRRVAELEAERENSAKKPGP